MGDEGLERIYGQGSLQSFRLSDQCRHRRKNKRESSSTLARVTVQGQAGEFSLVHADDWFASPITAELDQPACPKSGTNRKSPVGSHTIYREQRTVNYRTPYGFPHRAESLDEPDRSGEK